jgi:hypothetical protein
VGGWLAVAAGALETASFAPRQGTPPFVIYLLATPATGHRRYPPRAVTRPADQDVTLEHHADDVHRLCSAVAPDPGDLQS